MRQLEQIIQVVDGVSDRPHLAQLLFGGFQVLLHFFELREALFHVFRQLLLNLAADFHQLLVYLPADRLQLLLGALVEPLEFRLQLCGGAGQRRRQFGARPGQAGGLLAAPAGEVLFERGMNFLETGGQPVGNLLPQVALGKDPLEAQGSPSFLFFIFLQSLIDHPPDDL